MTHCAIQLITDLGRYGAKKNERAIREGAAQGLDWVQVREKNLNDRDLFRFVQLVMSWVSGTDCRVLVNGRFDLALAAGADGVHLPSRGIPAEVVRKQVRDGMTIGVSIHDPDEIHGSSKGADYVVLGTIFKTQSKPLEVRPLGIEAVSRAAQQGIPVFAVGGISADRATQAMAAGASGVAAISFFLDSDHPGERVRALRKAAEERIGRK